MFRKYSRKYWIDNDEFCVHWSSNWSGWDLMCNARRRECIHPKTNHLQLEGQHWMDQVIFLRKIGHGGERYRWVLRHCVSPNHHPIPHLLDFQLFMYPKASSPLWVLILRQDCWPSANAKSIFAGELNEGVNWILRRFLEALNWVHFLPVMEPPVNPSVNEVF